MLKTFARRLSRRLGNVLKLLSPDDLDDSILEKEKNLYKRGIIKEARMIDLYEEEVATGTDAAEAVMKIGYLAYAGGPPATKCAGGYLPKFAEILSRTDISGDLKIAILKTISIITTNHLEYQDQCADLGLVRLVAGIICVSSESVLLWAMYCLHNMIVGNIRNMQTIVEDSMIQEALENAELLEWTGFKCNYAAAVLRLTGLNRSTADNQGTAGINKVVKKKETVTDEDFVRVESIPAGNVS